MRYTIGILLKDDIKSSYAFWVFLFLSTNIAHSAALTPSGDCSIPVPWDQAHLATEQRDLYVFCIDSPGSGYAEMIHDVLRIKKITDMTCIDLAGFVVVLVVVVVVGWEGEQQKAKKKRDSF